MSVHNNNNNNNNNNNDDDDNSISEVDTLTLLTLLRTNFRTTLNLQNARRIEEFAEIVYTRSEPGSCYYEAFINGIYHHRLLSEHFPHWTNRPLDDIKYHWSECRFAIRQWLELNAYRFADASLVRSPDGTRFSAFPRTRQRVIDIVGRRIFERGINFDEGCTSRHWADVYQILPICAAMFQYTFVCLSNRTGNHHTHIAHWDPNTERVTMFYFPGEYIVPLPGWIGFWLDSNHFTYLRC